MNAYSEAHLFVAAIRVLQHRKASPPSLEEVCELLQISVELGNTIRRKLTKSGIVNSLEDPFGVKIMVGDHVAIESLPKEAPVENSLARELAEFHAKKKNSDAKVAAIKAEVEKKKKDMFADLEAKLRKEIHKRD